MKKAEIVLAALAPALAFGGVQPGAKLPEVAVQQGGLLVPDTKLVKGRMVLVSKTVGRRPWTLAETEGRVRTVYHLAARMGIDEINKPFIDALIAANLPEHAPEGAYKTITVLNLDDALWGTTGLGRSRLEDSQRDFPHALHVLDEKGIARAAWGLKAKSTAVIVLDRDGTVLFAKEGRLSADEIARAVGIIKEKLGLK